LAVAGKALQMSEDALLWPDVLQDPQRLSKFLQGVRALEKFGKEGREKAREYFFQQTDVPGFMLVNGRRISTLQVETLLLLVSKGDETQVREALRIAVEIQGDMSKESYFALCQKLSIQPDETLLQVNRGEPFVRSK
jgi:hypothetical protein